MPAEKLFVRSHVARDFLQSAALFKNEKLVVWEYVANGLQYSNANTNPCVRVTLDPKRRRITVVDNGRGMDRKGLENFFVVHGENQDRKAGKIGRGRFGTGKCAAFGIADAFRITSVCGGKLNCAELTRAEIDRAGEKSIPVRQITVDEVTIQPNGTTIEIWDVKLRGLDPRSVVQYIERHLAKWPKGAIVTVNDHICEYQEPPIQSFETIAPDADTGATIGDTPLRLNVSKRPLERDEQGVAVFSNGVWLETTMGGNEGQPMSQYIFGEIDVPRLDQDESSIPVYDMSRSMELNRNNELVGALIRFIGREVDRLRRDLVAKDRVRRAQEDQRRLAREADRIAALINEDFMDFRRQIEKVKVVSGRAFDAGKEHVPTGDDDVLMIRGGTMLVVEGDEAADSIGDRGNEINGATNGDNSQQELHASESGEPAGKPIGGSGSKRKPRGGFQVSFKEMGESSHRAEYNRDERTIFVNLEHPQIAAAKGTASEDDPTFRRIAYEVAFSEYAIALASELARQSEYIEPSDPNGTSSIRKSCGEQPFGFGTGYC